jgi:hypothetical protein
MNQYRMWLPPFRLPAVTPLQAANPVHATVIWGVAQLIARAWGVPVPDAADAAASIVAAVTAADAVPASDAHPAEATNDSEASARARVQAHTAAIGALVADSPGLHARLCSVTVEAGRDAAWLLGAAAVKGESHGLAQAITLEHVLQHCLRVRPSLASVDHAAGGLAALEAVRVVTAAARGSTPAVATMRCWKLLTDESGGADSWPAPPPAPAEDVRYDPVVMSAVRCVPPGFTAWDRVEVNVPQHITVGGLIQRLRAALGVEPQFVSAGGTILHSTATALMRRGRSDELLARRLLPIDRDTTLPPTAASAHLSPDLVAALERFAFFHLSVLGALLPPTDAAGGTAEEEEDAQVPPVRLRFWGAEWAWRRRRAAVVACWV